VPRRADTLQCVAHVHFDPLLECRALPANLFAFGLREREVRFRRVIANRQADAQVDPCRRVRPAQSPSSEGPYPPRKPPLMLPAIGAPVSGFVVNAGLPGRRGHEPRCFRGDVGHFVGCEAPRSFDINVAVVTSMGRAGVPALSAAAARAFEGEPPHATRDAAITSAATRQFNEKLFTNGTRVTGRKAARLFAARRKRAQSGGPPG
jgi:hypothetical protein